MLLAEYKVHHQHNWRFDTRLGASAKIGRINCHRSSWSKLAIPFIGLAEDVQATALISMGTG
jgi:hypothetical protein